MPTVLLCSDAEIAALRALRGPPRAAVARLVDAARAMVETIKHGEHLTGRPRAADLARLERALHEVSPPPPKIPEWRPDPQ